MKAFYLLFLFSLLSFGQNSGSDGYGKGEADLPTYSNSFYGNGTVLKKFHLNGRIIEKTDFEITGINCDQVGKVVVKVKVNKEGRVTTAEVTRGTTNTAACLVVPSIEKAKLFKWKEDKNAPDVQIGYIVFIFTQEIP